MSQFRPVLILPANTTQSRHATPNPGEFQESQKKNLAPIQIKTVYPPPPPDEPDEMKKEGTIRLGLMARRCRMQEVVDNALRGYQEIT